MPISRSKVLKICVAIVGGLLEVLTFIFPTATASFLEKWLGISDTTIVMAIMIVICIVGLVAIILVVAMTIWQHYKQKLNRNVVIQKDSLRFNKYPYLIADSLKSTVRMTNTTYSEITIENCEEVSRKCSVEITLKGKKKYRSKVLSSDSTDASNPNPIWVSVDARSGTKGFHPLCFRPLNFEAFLPNHSLGVAGAFDGTLVEHGEYEVLGRVLYDDKESKIVSLGKVKIPDDFLEKAKIPNDVQVRIDQGGFAVFLERIQDKVRAKFFGHNDDNDIRKVFSEYFLGKIPQIDDILEDNGKLEDITDLTFGIKNKIK